MNALVLFWEINHVQIRLKFLSVFLLDLVMHLHNSHVSSFLQFGSFLLLAISKHYRVSTILKLGVFHLVVELVRISLISLQ